MCFNPFGGFRWPYFGSEPKTKNSKLQDRAEDISFEEVKESATEQPKIDEKARAKQIADAVDARLSDLVQKNPMAGLMYVTSFITGANWADEHPLSNYNDRTAWFEAQHDEVQKLVKRASINDRLFETILFATFADGAMWAKDNPAPTL